MVTRTALRRDSRFLWLLSYLLAYVTASCLLMLMNTGLLGLGDPKFGAGGWIIYWPLWGAMFLPPVFVASFVVELWWPAVSRTALHFLIGTLATYLAAMEVSFLLDLQLPTLGIELAVLCVATVAVARKWLRHDN
jgi:hypothetical protein